MGLRFDPIGGGQFKEAVRAIIEVEKQPIKSLEVRKHREESKMKLFGEFKAKFTDVDKVLAEFTNFKKFRELKVDLGDGANLMSVTFDKETAEPGSYLVQIDQLAKRSSVISNGFTDPEEKCLGIGFVVVQLANGNSAEIFVDEENASLRGVSKLINQQSDSPIRASVVKDSADPDAPWRVIFAAKNDGAGNSVYFPELYFLDGTEDFYIDNESDSQNALLQVEGFPIEADNNHIKDFLQGVNVQLKAARPETPFTMTITEDYQKISGKVKGLIDQLNGVLEFINKQNQVDDKSDTRTTFAGDTSLQTIEYRIRNLVHEGFPVFEVDEDGEQELRFVFLNELGIEFDKTGKIGFKEEKFTKLLEGDFDGIAEAITGEYGFAAQTRQVFSGYTRPSDGLLAIREAGLRSRIKKLDSDIEQKERRLESRSQSLVAQFSRLQASLGNLQRQQQYLQASLPGAGGGGNLVQQLLGG